MQQNRFISKETDCLPIKITAKWRDSFEGFSHKSGTFRLRRTGH